MPAGLPTTLDCVEVISERVIARCTTTPSEEDLPTTGVSLVLIGTTRAVGFPFLLMTSPGATHLGPSDDLVLSLGTGHGLPLAVRRLAIMLGSLRVKAPWLCRVPDSELNYGTSSMYDRRHLRKALES